MASRTAKRTSKRRNGVGDSLTVLFDQHDSSERRALEASRLLAAKHGRRKQVIIALLEAVYAHYEATGELLSSAEIGAALMGQGTAVPRQQAVSHQRKGYNLPSTSTDLTPEQRRATLHHAAEKPGAVVTDGAKASAAEVGANFVRGMSAAFFYDPS